MDWDNGVVRPVALDRLGQRYRRIAWPIRTRKTRWRDRFGVGVSCRRWSLACATRTWSCSMASSTLRRPNRWLA